mmetsp:Transcript_8229/g.30353  ORF Transcript_8229/g.30353 Transcript_8229/m.30353 type:complete len:92 (-) Transcript_8229:71-346(-)
MATTCAMTIHPGPLPMRELHGLCQHHCDVGDGHEPKGAHLLAHLLLDKRLDARKPTMRLSCPDECCDKFAGTVEGDRRRTSAVLGEKPQSL